MLFETLQFIWNCLSFFGILTLFFVILQHLDNRDLKKIQDKNAAAHAARKAAQ